MTGRSSRLTRAGSPRSPASMSQAVSNRRSVCAPVSRDAGVQLAQAPQAAQAVAVRERIIQDDDVEARLEGFDGRVLAGRVGNREAVLRSLLQQRPDQAALDLVVLDVQQADQARTHER